MSSNWEELNQKTIDAMVKGKFADALESAGQALSLAR